MVKNHKSPKVQGFERPESIRLDHRDPLNFISSITVSEQGTNLVLDGRRYLMHLIPTFLGNGDVKSIYAINNFFQK